ALRRLDVNYQAAILRRHQSVDLDDSGFGVHRNVRDLHASHTLGRKPFAQARILAGGLYGLGAQLGASLFPGETLGSIALHANVPADGLELVWRRTQTRRYRGK